MLVPGPGPPPPAGRGNSGAASFPPTRDEPVGAARMRGARQAIAARRSGAGSTMPHIFSRL